MSQQFGPHSQHPLDASTSKQDSLHPPTRPTRIQAHPHPVQGTESGLLDSNVLRIFSARSSARLHRARKSNEKSSLNLNEHGKGLHRGKNIGKTHRLNPPQTVSGRMLNHLQYNESLQNNCFKYITQVLMKTPSEHIKTIHQHRRSVLPSSPP